MAVWKYRAQGGRLYRLARAHNLDPTHFSALLNGSRVSDDDPRLLAMGLALGLDRDECFENEHDRVVSTERAEREARDAE